MTETPTLTPADRVKAAIRCFECITKPGQLALYYAAAGVHGIVAAAGETADLPAMIAPLLPRGPAAIYAAAPTVAETLAPDVSAEESYFGLENVSALLTVGDDGFRLDRINHSAIFGARLTTELHSRALQMRGSPMMRAIRISRALNVPLMPDTQIH